MGKASRLKRRREKLLGPDLSHLAGVLTEAVEDFEGRDPRAEEIETWLREKRDAEEVRAAERSAMLADPTFNPPPIEYAEGEGPPEPVKCTCVRRRHEGNRRVPGPFYSVSGRAECRFHIEDYPEALPWGRDDGHELVAAEYS